MTTQRFCPLCDRVFADGEAVLRCSGCEVLHHPGCWVKNGGCATEREHVSQAIALAYSTEAPVSTPAPHPGEGTRLRKPPELAPLPSETGSAPEPAMLQQRMARAQVRRADLGGQAHEQPHQRPAPPPAEPVIGGEDFAPHVRPSRLPYNPEPVGSQHQSEHAARVAKARLAGDHPANKPLPSVYVRHKILRYWYVPAAVALAVLVAFAVIWTTDKISGGDGDDKAEATTEPSPGATQQPSGTTATATASTSATQGNATRTATPSGNSTKFKVGDTTVVTGTGDCLNVRVKAGRSNDAIVCLADGEKVTVTGGPEAADSLQWWKVSTKSGEGWAAEDYLAKQ